jgi:hypothetical protein
VLEKMPKTKQNSTRTALHKNCVCAEVPEVKHRMLNLSEANTGRRLGDFELDSKMPDKAVKAPLLKGKPTHWTL